MAALQSLTVTPPPCGPAPAWASPSLPELPLCPQTCLPRRLCGFLFLFPSLDSCSDFMFSWTISSRCHLNSVSFWACSFLSGLSSRSHTSPSIPCRPHRFHLPERDSSARCAGSQYCPVPGPGTSRQLDPLFPLLTLFSQSPAPDEAPPTRIPSPAPTALILLTPHFLFRPLKPPTRVSLY